MSSRILVDEIYGKTSGGSALTIDSNNYVIAANKPYVFADMSQTSGTNQYVSISVGSAIPFGTVIEGDSSLLNTSTYKFQCPVDGLYMMAYGLHVNGGQHHAVTRNALRYQFCYEQSAGTLHNTAVIRCTAGDQLWLQQLHQAQAYYNGGGSDLDGDHANRYTYIHYALVG